MRPDSNCQETVGVQKGLGHEKQGGGRDGCRPRRTRPPDGVERVSQRPRHVLSRLFFMLNSCLPFMLNSCLPFMLKSCLSYMLEQLTDSPLEARQAAILKRIPGVSLQSVQDDRLEACLVGTGQWLLHHP